MASVGESEVDALYRASVRPLYARICRQAAGDHGLAQDVAQETWLRAIEHWRRHGLPDNPDAWLHRVARNLLVSHYRRVGREVPSDNDAPAACDEASPEERVAVRQTLGWLGASRALLLRAFHIEGRTTAELAADTGLSERAVEGRPPAPPRYPGARGSAHGA